MAWDGDWSIYTIDDPKNMINEKCAFQINDDNLIFSAFSSSMAPAFNEDYLCFFSNISDWLGYSWVLDREQLIEYCKNHIEMFNHFDFDRLPTGFYAVVWRDYS